MKKLFSSRRRSVALVLAGMVLGGIMITPAGAHVTNSVTHLKGHLRPWVQRLIDAESGRERNISNARYEDQVAVSGQTVSGVFGAAASIDSVGFAPINFDPTLPADIPLANAHRMATDVFDEICPALGQAAPGHLCLYETHNMLMTFGDFSDPHSAGTAVRTRGALPYWASSSPTGNVRGTWAVTVP